MEGIKSGVVPLVRALWVRAGDPDQQVKSMQATLDTPVLDTLRTLPCDDVRQIMWRFADRYDLHMLVQARARRGARTGRPARRRRRAQLARLDAGQGQPAASTSTKAASPRRSWTRNTAASSPARRISRWR